jgi:hypothetical protein
MQGFWQNAKRNVFTLMYLMSETSVRERSYHVEIAIGISIIFLDFFQTLRTAITPEFGWPTDNSLIAVVRAFDFVESSFSLLHRRIHRCYNQFSLLLVANFDQSVGSHMDIQKFAFDCGHSRVIFISKFF